MSHPIGCDSPHFVDYQSKEVLILSGSTAAFAVFTTAIVSVIIVFQASYSTPFIITYAVLGTAEAASLTLFLTGLVMLHLKNRSDIEQVHASIEKLTIPAPARAPTPIAVPVLAPAQSKPSVDISIATVPPTTHPYAVGEPDQEAPLINFEDYIQDFRNDLPILFHSIENFLCSAIAYAYFQPIPESYEQQQIDALQDPITTKQEHVRVVLGAVREEMHTFLSDQTKIMRAAVQLISIACFDNHTLLELRKIKETELLLHLVAALERPQEIEESQFIVICQIIRHLGYKVNESIADNRGESTTDKGKEKISTAGEGKDSKNNILLEKILAFKNAEDEQVASAFSDLLDHLYTAAEIPEKQIQQWIAQLILPFLEAHREEFFKLFSNGSTHAIGVFKQSFENKGIFNSLKARAAVIAFGVALKTDKVQREVNAGIDLALTRLPFTDSNKDIFRNTLFPLLVEIFLLVNNLFDWQIRLIRNENPFRLKIRQILQTISIPQISDTGSDCVRAYAKVLYNISDQLAAPRT